MNSAKLMHLKTLLLFLFFLSTLFPSCHSKSGKRLGLDNDGLVVGKVVHIVDGDTYHLLTDSNRSLKVRMDGIDAPEREMPFYRVSKDYLGQLCYNKTVKLKITGEDRNGRTLGFTYLEDGTELGREMIRAGLAWHFKRYNTERELSNLEIEARKAKRGLWADDNPTSPWEYRKQQREGF